MPPKAAPEKGGRRKAPSFQPPRPIKSTAQPAVAASRSNNFAKAAPTKPTKATAANATIISSDEEQEDDLDIASDFDELMEDALDENITAPRPPPPASFPPSEPPVPAPLLARLLHEHFEDKNTQIQKGAMDLFGNYISIFVREAIARAKSERDDVAKASMRSEAFLQVEDLEKLAPQLVLDF